MLSGHFKWGYNVEFGYFEQLASKSASSKTIYQHLPTWQTNGELSEENTVRSVGYEPYK